jgi:ABC-type transport system substrate-binding protein
MKKLIYVFLALALVLSLSACGKQTADTAVQEDTAVAESDNTPAAYSGEKKVVIGLPADPETLEPWAPFNNGRRDCMPIIYQTLISMTPDLVSGATVTEYILATGWEKVAPNTYEIKIRQGIKDTAGNDFTAADAAFSYDTAKAQGVLAQLNAIDHTEVVDDYTFRLIASRTLAVGDFEDLLTGFNMITKKAYEASPDGMKTDPVGTTGYVLSEYVPGSRVVYTKADSYWNEAANLSKSAADGYSAVWDTTNVDTVQYEIITDTTTMTVALETGQIDFATSVAGNDVERFQADPGKFSVYTYPDNMYQVSFNTDSGSPTSNYNLRMALALAIDSEGILNAAYNGKGITLNAWAYPTFFDYQKKWDSKEPFPYDAALAKEYLQKYFDETGTKASDLRLKLLTVNRPATKKASEAIQAYVVDLIGNPNCLEIASYDQAQFEALWLDPTEFDLLVIYTQTISRTYCTYQWNNYANAKKLANGFNLWYDTSDEVQSLIEAAIGEDTHSDATVSAFQQYIDDNALLKNLICGEIYAVAESWVKDIKIGPKQCFPVCGFEYDWNAKG